MADAPSDPAPGRPGAGAALAATMAAAEGKRERSRSLKPLGRLAPYVWRHRRDAALGLLFLLLSTSSTLSLTGAARLVTDHGFAAGSSSAVNKYFLLAVGVAVLLALATACRFYFVQKTGERVVADLRQDLYAHVLTLDQSFFMDVRTGEVLSRVTTDVAMVESAVGPTASTALRNLLMVVGALALLVFVSPKLTLGVLVLVPVVVAPIAIFGRRVRRLSVSAQDRFAQAVGFAGEALDQLDTVQAFNRQRIAAARFGAAVDEAFGVSLDRIRARAGMTAMVITLVFGGVAAVLWLGAHDVVSGRMSGGALVQFLFLSVLAASSVGALGEVWGEVQKASGAMVRIGEILDARPAVRAPVLPKPLPEPARGEIAFEDVRFHYPGRPDLPALDGFSLHVRPGETVALVGPSGGGKSTVLRLLLRFYDPQSGVVRLDGVDLRDADPEAVRARLALVSQEASLFSDSVEANIRFGRQDADAEAIYAAARAAEAHGFVEGLPGGYASALGERGRALSGGQRQRLAIARALVRDAPVLLLDEATSALDAENERLVQRALDEAMRGRTTLVIAHRLATVLRANRIAVVDRGRVVEMGSHAELVARGGLYARLAQLQFAGDALTDGAASASPAALAAG
ncbi:MAG: ATP-binding cassette domain-containing protein [Caulobacteraceae bacterium]|nr:ATP-binding cassette domain-containing protein [Caulobacter sp.]